MIIIIEGPAGIEPVTYWFVVYAQAHCVTLICNYHGKDGVFLVILDFIVVFFSIGSSSQYGRVPYHLKTSFKTKGVLNFSFYQK